MRERQPHSEPVHLGLKTILITALVTSAVLLGGTELAVRVYYYQKHAPEAFGVVQVGRALIVRLAELRYSQLSTVSADKPLFRPDPVTGYSCIPGVHNISFVRKDGKLTYQVVIGEDGYRTTSPDPSVYSAKPEVWIFGCSFVYGEGVNNQDTFPWLLQAGMRDWAVRNLALPAFGNLQALLQLRHAVDTKQKLPLVAVFVYSFFHPERNAGAPSWLARIHTAWKAYGAVSYRYPRAIVSPEGDFTVDYADLNRDSWKDEPDPEVSAQVFLTKVIFYRLRKLCESNGILPVIALQVGRQDDSVVQYARQIGFRFIDMSFHVTRADRLLPFDSHPNRRAYSRYEDRLGSALKPLLESRLAAGSAAWEDLHAP